MWLKTLLLCVACLTHLITGLPLDRRDILDQSDKSSQTDGSLLEGIIRPSTGLLDGDPSSFNAGLLNGDPSSFNAGLINLDPSRVSMGDPALANAGLLEGSPGRRDPVGFALSQDVPDMWVEGPDDFQGDLDVFDVKAMQGDCPMVDCMMMDMFLQCPMSQREPVFFTVNGVLCKGCLQCKDIEEGGQNQLPDLPRHVQDVIERTSYRRQSTDPDDSSATTLSESDLVSRKLIEGHPEETSPAWSRRPGSGTTNQEAPRSTTTRPSQDPGLEETIPDGSEEESIPSADDDPEGSSLESTTRAERPQRDEVDLSTKESTSSTTAPSTTVRTSTETVRLTRSTESSTSAVSDSQSALTQ